MMVLFSIDQKPHWSLLSLPCWRHHFPTETLVVVDHNQNPDERPLAEKHGAVVLPKSTVEISHGDGIDTAAAWCRANRYDVLVHIEPDCLMWGRDWYDKLVEPIGEESKWMTGLNRTHGGVIHPCPSAWYLPKVVHSFRCVAKGKEVSHPEYPRIVDVPGLERSRFANFVLNWWDTGIKNYYEAAKQGRALYVGPASDFQHYWEGHRRWSQFSSRVHWDWNKPLHRQVGQVPLL